MSYINSLAALSFFPKITYTRYKQLISYFPNNDLIWSAELTDLVEAGWQDHIAHEFTIWQEKNPLEKLATILEKEKIHTISLNEPHYPKILKEIFNPPITLFIRGKLPSQDKPALGVVGTRKVSPYGQQVCEKLIKPLAKNGITIVSGLALGLDTIAHKTTLDVGGQTIAILGSGIDDKSIYPFINRSLANKIITEDGAIISEYPPGTPPTKYTFPARNRIIAGLTFGTLVVEAPKKSGALITSRYALDYNREVLSVPHPITSPNGEGCNNLLKLGGKVVTKPEDILDTLNLSVLQIETSEDYDKNLSNDELSIFNLLSHEPKHIDLIIQESLHVGAIVNSLLTMLEIKGIVRNIGGMRYTKS